MRAIPGPFEETHLRPRKTSFHVFGSALSKRREASVQTVYGNPDVSFRSRPLQGYSTLKYHLRERVQANGPGEQRIYPPKDSAIRQAH